MATGPWVRVITFADGLHWTDGGRNVMEPDGPYDVKPEFDVTETEGMEFASSVTQPRWLQVKNGEWWAFYSNVGPDKGPTDYGIEHPYNPNFWLSQLHGEEWACRHGWLVHRPCGSCGPLPDPEVPDDMEVSDVRAKLEGMVRALEGGAMPN